MMDHLVREALFRLMPSEETLSDEFFMGTFFMLACVCVSLVNEVKTLGATYGLVQLLRMLAIAHVLRFVQSRLGKTKVPPALYLEKVLQFYDLRVTIAISAFYTIIRIFPSPRGFVLFLVISLLFGLIISAPKLMELEQDMSSTQGSSSDADQLVHQQNPIDDIQVNDHFATILLAVICVDLAVELEALKGTYKLFSMVFVLASRHIPYFSQPRKGENKVPLASYLVKVLPSYDLPIIAVINGFHIIFRTFSKTLFLLFCMELILLAWTHILMYKREELTKAKKLLWTFCKKIASVIKQWRELKQDINPTQTPSSNTELVHQPDFSKWVKGDRIGGGQFGHVYVVQHRETKKQRAVKELNIGQNENDESIRQEVQILSQLKYHRNIVKYYGYNIDERDHICLYMEYIKQGSLHDYVVERGKLGEPLVKDFIAQILSGMCHLHENKVVHRDIKPENLLVGTKNTVKLVDFGLAKVLAESKGKHSVWGTPYYAAPELHQNQKYESSSEAYKADIWSLGCVVIFMFSGQHPLWQNPEAPHPQVPEDLSEEGQKFLKRCFKRNPADRPSAKKLRTHIFVKAQYVALLEERRCSNQRR